MTYGHSSYFAASPSRQTLGNDSPASVRGSTDPSRQELTPSHQDNVPRKVVPVPFTDKHLRQLSSQLRGDPSHGRRAERTRDAEAFLNDPKNLAILHTNRRRGAQITRQAPTIPKNPLMRSSSASTQDLFFGLSAIPKLDGHKPSDKARVDLQDYGGAVGYLNNQCQERIHDHPEYNITQDKQGLYSGSVKIGKRVFTIEKRSGTLREAKAAVARAALKGLEKSKVWNSRVDKSFTSLSPEQKFKFRMTQLKNWTTNRKLPDPEYSIARDPTDSRRFFGLAKVAYRDFRSQESFEKEPEAMAAVACYALGWFCQTEGLEHWKRLQAQLAAAPFEGDMRSSVARTYQVKHEPREESMVPPPIKDENLMTTQRHQPVAIKEGKLLFLDMPPIDPLPANNINRAPLLGSSPCAVKLSTPLSLSYGSHKHLIHLHMFRNGKYYILPTPILPLLCSRASVRHHSIHPFLLRPHQRSHRRQRRRSVSASRVRRCPGDVRYIGAWWRMGSGEGGGARGQGHGGGEGAGCATGLAGDCGLLMAEDHGDTSGNMRRVSERLTCSSIIIIQCQPMMAAIGASSTVC